ncbi:inositol monophosphatase family protein [Streptomyces sp. VRA16 Mangrove soil]|uniref:inositol monophosphatase family protein n=1 Tax=Streptomyces sp. VRA16 Mangrove soil TaxID=2817434 RepID=UPI001A9F6191|nr:inositol monophosphatase family protein [Streptomyces sp. VRA16 Mangrove soil]MBO1331165.1 inositol monophosphatase [Streptomyces sp. VRA16 Mangrove soil]
MIETTTESIDDFLTSKVTDELVRDVERIVRAAAAAEITPRFRQLAAHEIQQKSAPHDLVTVADRRAEEYLTRELAAVLPGAVVVGEEAVAADPTTYEAIRGAGPVWIVDPVDGTRQFVHGDPGFCTLVALTLDGVVLASWTWAPALDEFAVAVRGRGATLNGRALHAGSPEPGTDLRIATSHPDYTTDDQKRALTGLWTDGVAPRPCGSAGLEYLAVARGAVDAVAFSWELAWDHAAGLLLVEEAGGAHLTRTGEPFRITGGNALPFTAARDPRAAERVRGLLAGPGAV